MADQASTPAAPVAPAAPAVKTPPPATKADLVRARLTEMKSTGIDLHELLDIIRDLV